MDSELLITLVNGAVTAITTRLQSKSYKAQNQNSIVFSRACHRLHVFPRLPPFTCFPALTSVYMFSRAYRRLHVFPRLSPFTCFHVCGLTRERRAFSRRRRSCASHIFHSFLPATIYRFSIYLCPIYYCLLVLSL